MRMPASTIYRVCALTISALCVASPAAAVDLLQGSTCHNNKCFQYKVTVDTQTFLATPKWSDLSTSPPLSAEQAAKAATGYAAKAFSTLPKSPRISRIDLRRHAFSQFGKEGPDLSDNWYYVVQFGVPFGTGASIPDTVVVLMNGAIAPAKIEEQK